MTAQTPNNEINCIEPWRWLYIQIITKHKGKTLISPTLPRRSSGGWTGIRQPAGRFMLTLAKCFIGSYEAARSLPIPRPVNPGLPSRVPNPDRLLSMAPGGDWGEAAIALRRRQSPPPRRWVDDSEYRRRYPKNESPGRRRLH